jgi:hypothetical protein
MLENDELFPCDPLDSKAALSEALKSCMSCDTVGELMLHMGRDLALRCLEGRPGEHGKEATMRELISPIIFAAAALTEDIRVLAEYGVHGTRASGSIDWVLLFKRFSIVIVEVVKHLRAIIMMFLAYCIAHGSLSIQRLTRSCPCIQHLQAKLHDKVEDHLGQLAAEMHSAREEYSISQLGKRKHEEPPELQQVRCDSRMNILFTPPLIRILLHCVYLHRCPPLAYYLMASSTSSTSLTPVTPATRDLHIRHD